MTLKHEDLEFIAGSKEAMIRSFPLSMHLILWLSFIFLVIAGLWASIAPVDEVTMADGKVIPARNIQIIQNLEGGIIKSINVKEGDEVDKDQILIVIDDTKFASSFGENQVQVSALEAKIVRLEAQVQGTEPQYKDDFKNQYSNFVNNELSLYNSEMKELKIKIDILQGETNQKKQELTEAKNHQIQLQSSYDLANKELALTKPLVVQGAASEVEVIRLERSVNDMKGELEANQLSFLRLEDAVTEAQNRIAAEKAKFVSDSQEQLNTARADYQRLKQVQLALKDEVNRTSVRSPVHGTVNRIDVKTIGGIIKPGQDMVEIVPLDDTLLVEARVRPKDIAWINPGIHAKVKITAYDFSIYGGLDAKLEHISADTITNEHGESFYIINVRTDKNYLLGRNGDKLPIISGMTATVDLITGQKTVLDYLLKPFKKARYNALRER